MGRGRSGAGGSGNNAAKSEYEAAKRQADSMADRERNKPSGQRWEGDSHQQYLEARRRQADAGSEYLLSRVTDKMAERAMDEYIDRAIRSDGLNKTERWVKVLAGTKKDGSPTARARKNARLDRADYVATALSRSIGINYNHLDMSSAQRSKEQDRLADPIMRAARKRMKSGRLKGLA